MPNFLQNLVQSGALNIPDPMASYQNALKMKAMQSQVKGAELDSESKIAEIAKGYMQRLTGPEEYPAYLQHMKKLGMPDSMMPEALYFAQKSPDEFENYRMNFIASSDAFLKMKMGESFDVSWSDPQTGLIRTIPVKNANQLKNLREQGLIPKEAGLGKLSGTYWKPKERIAEEETAKTEAELGAKKKAGMLETPEEKLERDKKLATFKGESAEQKAEKFGEPYIDKTTGALLQKSENTGKIQKIATPPKGFKIESDGKGGFTITYGDEKLMTTKTVGEVEEKILTGKEALARLQNISKEFKPEYMETWHRLGAEWTGIKAKLGQNVPQKDAAKLTEFKKFQRKAIEDINLYIKETTGAQMSQTETGRLRLAKADVGEHWYSGDDPITFKAKLDDDIKTIRAVTARYEWYKSQGLSDSKIKQIISNDEAISLDAIIGEMK